MESIKVRVNAAKLLASLRYAFTNRYTVVTELMQNARRAGATYVAIDYDAGAQALGVRDDGVGVADWQKLVSVGESGWDAATVRDEHAFGVGFMKSLYSARRCSVRSRDRMIAFDTASALQQAEIEVRTVEPIGGTIVRLEGVALADLARRMEALASAFPIPVIFNGCSLPRQLAIDARRFVATEIGAVHLVGLDDGKATAAMLLVLQGLVVDGDPRFDREANIVHLDPRRFLARLPDRDVLIDADEGTRQVRAVLETLWREHLTMAKAALSGEAFVTRYFDAAVKWGATDLFCDVPLLPGRLFARIVGYPIQEGYGAPRYLEALSGLVRWEQFRSEEIKAVVLPATEAENFPYWMFAKAKRLLVLTRSFDLAEKHWLWDHVLELEEDQPEVEIVGEHLRTTLNGQWIAPEVVLCEAYRVRVNHAAVEITDEAMYWTGRSGDAQLLLVPDGEHRGAAVEQCSSYLDDDDRWREESVHADREALAGLIRQLRTGDPAQALRSLLGGLRLERYPGLRGHVFSVEVGTEQGAHDVRLVA
jgi:hypothetical protein